MNTGAVRGPRPFLCPATHVCGRRAARSRSAAQHVRGPLVAPQGPRRTASRL